MAKGSNRGRRPRRRRNRQKDTTGEALDHFFESITWKILQAVPVLGDAIGAFAPDKVLESLASVEQTLQDVPPILSEQQHTLDGIRMLLVWSQEEQTRNREDTLDALKELFEGYHRSDLPNQLTGIFTSAKAIHQIRRLADQAESTAGSVIGIEQNMQSVNARGEYFPDHAHSYVRMMIERHAGEKVPHYFSLAIKPTLTSLVCCNKPLAEIDW